MPSNNPRPAEDGCRTALVERAGGARISVPIQIIADIADAAAALHRRLADALPADHMPAEAEDVALALSLAERLSGLLST